jgi:hypothetical protein
MQGFKVTTHRAPALETYYDGSVSPKLRQHYTLTAQVSGRGLWRVTTAFEVVGDQHTIRDPDTCMQPLTKRG